MKIAVVLLSAAFAVLYPLFIHLGIAHVAPQHLAILVLVIAVLRLLVTRKRKSLNLKAFTPFVLVGLASAVIVFFSNNALLLLHIPTLVNLGLFIVFLRSYFRPPTVIENFARMEYPVMPENAVRYCARVTLVWSASLLLCTCICFYLAQFGSRSTWLVWSSVGIYTYHGIVFGVEYLVRRTKTPGFDRAIEEMRAAEQG